MSYWAIFFEGTEVLGTRTVSEQGALNALYKVRPSLDGKSKQSLAMMGFLARKKEKK